MLAYSSHEPYFLNQQDNFFRKFTPREAGIDFYGDDLFTTESQIKGHPQRVEAFRRASMRGWAYAMENQEGIVDLILNKYTQNLQRNQLLFEAQAMEHLLANNLLEIGHMNPARCSRIMAVYQTLGKLQKYDILDGFIHKPPTVLLDIMKANHNILLTYLAGILLIVAFLIYRNRQLQKSNQKLQHISETDQLTGIYNRKRLDETLQSESERFLRCNSLFSVIIADIDKFKDINDNYGHHAGDEVLIQIVQIFSLRIRTTDTLGR